MGLADVQAYLYRPGQVCVSDLELCEDDVVLGREGDVRDEQAHLALQHSLTRQTGRQAAPIAVRRQPLYWPL